MAIDDSGYLVVVPKYVPETKEDKKLELVAMHAKDFATQLDKEF